ncbi:MAG: hypothetical protein HPY79_02590 [Bacteroidales bacterium]|nr:hypothetical protein [Bacteroidales bacterium]
MNKHWSYFLLLLFIFTSAISQNTTISFINKSYSNDTLYVLKEKDFITKIWDTIAWAKVNNNGEWIVKLNIHSTQIVHIPLYKNEIVVCVEPNNLYKIKVPLKQPLTIEDSLNTYFEPFIFYTTILNMDSTCTHESISRLEYSIDTLVQKYFKVLHFKIKRRTVDSLLNLLSVKYDHVSSKYFKQYLFYKIILMKYLSYERDQNFIIKYYFNDKPVLLNNAAYTELFNQIFNDYLSYYATTHWGEDVSDAITKLRSPIALRKAIKRNPAFTNDTLVDLVILKGLHDAYYSNDLPNKVRFSPIGIKTILDSMIFVAKTNSLKQMATNIRQKIKNDEIIYAFEEFPFIDIDGNELYLRNFKGKYVYLMIADFRSYEFLPFLKQEKASLTRFLDKMHVINIVLYPQKEKLKHMIKSHDLIGEYLFCKNDEKQFKKYFKIKALPQFMIWSSDGKVVNNNAPSPDDRIIPYLMQIIKD